MNDQGIDWVSNQIMIDFDEEKPEELLRISFLELNTVYRTVICKPIKDQNQLMAENFNWIVDRLIEDTKGSQVAFKS
jgi:hypothetical protein